MYRAREWGVPHEGASASFSCSVVSLEGSGFVCVCVCVSVFFNFDLTRFLDLSHTGVVRPGCRGNRTGHRNEGSLVCAVVPAKHLNGLVFFILGWRSEV